jgi:hypothetical protein
MGLRGFVSHLGERYFTYGDSLADEGGWAVQAAVADLVEWVVVFLLRDGIRKVLPVYYLGSNDKYKERVS